ncbi:TorF family putative porin [Hellea balneolensis]|uniref:TorF family putative porin n=1 Tax=Hellea balneolensis TaxID=287478 RepID=UPI00047AF032|nr:TorF family putative porin [Hellea balneolensis]
MKKLLLGATSILIAASATMPAQAGDISVSTSIDYVTDYVFRGVSLADTAIQPGVEVSAGDFTVGAWFSTGVGDTSIFAGDEVDLYASYSLPLSDSLSADVGITYYHYPQGGSLFSTNDGGSGTYEVFASLGFDAPLAPSVSAYYDFTLEAFTLEGGVGHSIATGDKTSLDLGATVGLVDGDGFSYEYGSASASVGYAFTDAVSAYVGVNYALSSEDTLDYKKIIQGGGKDNLLFAGAGIAAGF